MTKDGHGDIGFDNMWGTSMRFLVFITHMNFMPSVLIQMKKVIIIKVLLPILVEMSWEMLNTDGLKGVVEHLYKNQSKDIFIQSIDIGGGEHYDSTLIYEYSDGRYAKLYSSVWDKAHRPI